MNKGQLVPRVGIGLAVVPPLFMSWYANTLGSASFQDDYGEYIVHLEKIWNNGFSLSAVFDASPHGPHFLAIPIFLRVLAMYAGYWSAYIETDLSLAIGLVRVLLIYWMFRTVLRSPVARSAMLLLSTMLIFAPVQVGLYVYGDTGLPMGLDNLGFCLGLWGIVSYPKSWRAVFLAVAGGLLSTWSWGTGAAWAVMFLCLIAYRFSVKHLILFLVGMVAVYLTILRFFAALSAQETYNFTNFGFIADALGRPFSSDIVSILNDRASDGIGYLGLGLFASYTFLLVRRGLKIKPFPEKTLPGLAFIVYALVCLYQVCVTRTSISPWYVALSSNFWLGLGGIIIMQLETAFSDHGHTRAIPGLTVLAGLLVLYVNANQSLDTKTPFLSARTLSADACMRHYLTAPTMCEMLLFQWPPTYEFASFGRFFDQTQLAGSGRHQVWTLQGDYILDSVEADRNLDAPRVRWSKYHIGKTLEPANWLTFNRLTLLIPVRQATGWTVTLPPSTQSAVFRSNLVNQTVKPFTLQVQVESQGGKRGAGMTYTAAPLTTLSVSFDLTPFTGKAVTLVLQPAASQTEGNAALYYPHIDLDRVRNPTRIVSTDYRDIEGRPENVDAAAASDQVGSNIDIPLESQKAAFWQHTYSTVYEGVLTPAGEACTGDYKALTFEAGLSAVTTIRMLTIHIKALNANGTQDVDEITLPLLKDGNTHRYSLSYKQFGLEPDSKIQDVRLYTFANQDTSPDQQPYLTILNAKLLRNKSNGSYCNGVPP